MRAIVDELFTYHGELTHAFGHTDDYCIYWNRKGQAYSVLRDKSKKYPSLHDEQYSLTYERDSTFDLKPEEIIDHGRNTKD